MRDFIDKLRILWSFLWDAWDSWRVYVWPNGLDEPFCCDGRDCGCYGATNREIYLD